MVNDEIHELRCVPNYPYDKHNTMLCPQKKLIPKYAFKKGNCHIHGQVVVLYYNNHAQTFVSLDSSVPLHIQHCMRIHLFNGTVQL